MLDRMNRYFSNREREAQLADMFDQIKLQIEKKANEQKVSAGITSFKQEAIRIATACNMFNLGPQGYSNQNMLVNLGLEVLQYEPELGYAIVDQLNSFKDEIGYKPKGKLMTVIGQIGSIKHAPIVTKFSYLKARPELGNLIDDKDERCHKAGELLAVGILSTALSISEASKIYKQNDFDTLVKVSLDKTLRSWDASIAQKIIG
jgi:hypothetical protein